MRLKVARVSAVICFVLALCYFRGYLQTSELRRKWPGIATKIREAIHSLRRAFE